ncbi:unnamed protein product [Rhizophagus irregularis]|nr:unnamed protein product [Rhizophagus irregularis]
MSNEQGTYSVFGVNNSTLIPFPDFYDTMYFGGDSKTYRELVYTSRIKDTLNLTIENRQRQQHKRNTSPETEETTLNQDLPQLVVNPPSSIKEYPTPVSSIQLSPVTDFSEQSNEISYLMTPASSNHQSPVTSQYGSSDILTPESLNQQTPITSEDILSSMMYPQFSEITPISTYNNNSRVFSEDFLKFLYSADILALQPSTYVTYNTGIPDMTFNTDIPAIPAPDMTLNDMTFVPATPAPDMTYIAPDIPATLETLPKFIFNSTTNMNDQNKDFDLYPESEGPIPDITPPVAEPMTTSMENQIFLDIFEYDSNDVFSINATPVDQHYYDNGSSF